MVFRHCHVTPANPTTTTTSTVAASTAISGRRRADFANRSNALAGRTETGRPASQFSRSSARASAEM